MRLSHLKRDSRFKIQDSKCEKIRTLHSQLSALSLQPCESGFTLVEIAMVLVLLGALVAFGMTLVGPLTKKLKYNATKEIIQADIDGIEGWAYDGKLLPTSGTWATVVRNPNDAWIKSLVYIYDNNLTTASTGGICGKSTTALSTATISNMAFLILSGSDDYNIDTTLNGNLNGGAINGVITGSGYATGTVTVSANDIVYWVTLNELRTKAGCKGAQLQILNQELPVGITGQTYSATLYVDPAYAGVAPYTWSTGQAQGSCGAGNVQLVATYNGLCLNTTTGVISGTPTASGPSFTVTVTDANAITASKAFLIDVQ